MIFNEIQLDRKNLGLGFKGLKNKCACYDETYTTFCFHPFLVMLDLDPNLSRAYHGLLLMN